MVRQRSGIVMYAQQGTQLIPQVLELRGPSKMSLIEASTHLTIDQHWLWGRGLTVAKQPALKLRAVPTKGFC